jgi:hypothetical protein
MDNCICIYLKNICDYISNYFYIKNPKKIFTIPEPIKPKKSRSLSILPDHKPVEFYCCSCGNKIEDIVYMYKDNCFCCEECKSIFKIYEIA